VLALGPTGATIGAGFGMAVGAFVATGEIALTVGSGAIAAPAIVLGMTAMGAYAGHLAEELGLAIGSALDDWLMANSSDNSCDKEMKKYYQENKDDINTQIDKEQAILDKNFPEQDAGKTKQTIKNILNRYR
jgi:hypothetical protein